MKRFKRSAIIITVWAVAWWVVGNFVGKPYVGVESLVFNIWLVVMLFLGLTTSALIAVLDVLERTRNTEVTNNIYIDKESL